MDDVIFIAKDPMNYIKIMEYDDMKVGRDGKMSWSAKTCIKNSSEGIEKLLRCVSGLGTVP